MYYLLRGITKLFKLSQSGIYRLLHTHLCGLHISYSRNIYPFKIWIFLTAVQLFLRVLSLVMNENLFGSIVIYDLSLFINDHEKMNIVIITMFATIMAIERIIYKYNSMLIHLFRFYGIGIDGISVWERCRVRRSFYTKLQLAYLLSTYAFTGVFLAYFIFTLQYTHYLPRISSIMKSNMFDPFEMTISIVCSTISSVTMFFCLYFFLWRINFWFSMVSLWLIILLDSFNWNYGNLSRVVVRFKAFNSLKIRHGLFRLYLATEYELTNIMLQLNRPLGQVLSLTITTLSPCSAYLVITTLSLDENSLIAIYSLLIAMAQIFFLFIFHGFVAQFVTVLKKPAKIFYNIITSRTVSLKTRLRINFRLQHIHSKTLLGFTYSSFGLITFISFFRFLFVYTKILMILRKNLQREFL